MAFISDKVRMTKLQPNTVIRAALDLLNEVGGDGLTTRKLAERLGFSSRRFTGTSGTSGRCSTDLAEAMLAENHAHSVPRADDDWRSFLINAAVSGQACSPTAMARNHAGIDRLRRWKRPTRSFASLCEAVFDRGRRQCADDNRATFHLLGPCWRSGPAD